MLPSDPQRWGALSVACHPGGGWYLSLCFPLGYALLPVSQLAAVYHILYIFFFYHFLSPHPSRDRSKSKLLFYICILLYYLLLLNPKSFQLHGTLSVFRAGWVTLAMHKPRGLLPVGALLLCAHDPAQMTGYRCPGTWLSCIWPSYLKVGRGHYRGPSAALCRHTYIHTRDVKPLHQKRSAQMLRLVLWQQCLAWLLQLCWSCYQNHLDWLGAMQVLYALCTSLHSASLIRHAMVSLSASCRIDISPLLAGPN